ncbi:Flap endonuclease 1 [Dirofilaria immitis]|nr:Flap endonuclease 1 [Dirofilaria immitis]
MQNPIALQHIQSAIDVMGVKDLSKVIGDYSPGSIRLNEFKGYFGRKVAVDASMCLYQFLIAVRQDGSQLQTESGETTSHLLGMFYRTIRMIDNGIKPVYVFDGKPPKMKTNELEKRTERRSEAENQRNEAIELGDEASVSKFERRLVKVTKEQNEEAKRLVTLMGIPILNAPCEAEAQCAALAKAGKVFATVSEDMDALTFGSPILCSGFERFRNEYGTICRSLHSSGLRLCINYSRHWSEKAFELITKYRCIENILETIDQTKYPIPKNWQYKEARRLFLEPDVINCENLELVWREPDVEGIVEFLCGEKSFNENRVRSSLIKMQKGRQTAQQARIDSFFSISKIVTSETTKRKNEERKNDLKKRGRVWDKEIVALSQSDFERTVSETDEIWFINFYSTFCSRCHQLMPTRYFFHGQRQLKLIAAFVMEYVTDVVLELTDSDIDLFEIKRMRNMFMDEYGIVNVAKVNCDKSLKLCALFDHKSGVLYFGLMIEETQWSMAQIRDHSFLVRFGSDEMDNNIKLKNYQGE